MNKFSSNNKFLLNNEDGENIAGKIIFSIICLSKNLPMKQNQEDLSGNPIYKCNACKKSHKISVHIANNEYYVTCLECYQKMRRGKTLESPYTYNYICTNVKCKQFNKQIQINKAKI